MIIRNTKLGLPALVAVLLFLLTGMSTVMADQVSISYVDSSGDPQTLVVDKNSSTADLALAAALSAENGVSATHNSNAGSGSLAEIAAAMAAAAPVFAASVAEFLSDLSADDTAAIVAAINAVPGVNINAVLAAVWFGPPNSLTGPQSLGSDAAISLEFTEVESIPSKN